MFSLRHTSIDLNYMRPACFAVCSLRAGGSQQLQTITACALFVCYVQPARLRRPTTATNNCMHPACLLRAAYAHQKTNNYNQQPHALCLFAACRLPAWGGQQLPPKAACVLLVCCMQLTRFRKPTTAINNCMCPGCLLSAAYLFQEIEKSAIACHCVLVYSVQPTWLRGPTVATNNCMRPDRKPTTAINDCNRQLHMFC
eukprot:scaffold143923_cov20-Tisochrysis_lutea.AAC.1